MCAQLGRAGRTQMTRGSEKRALLAALTREPLWRQGLGRDVRNLRQGGHIAEPAKTGRAEGVGSGKLSSSERRQARTW